LDPGWIFITQTRRLLKPHARYIKYYPTKKAHRTSPVVLAQSSEVEYVGLPIGYVVIGLCGYADIEMTITFTTTSNSLVITIQASKLF